MTTTSTTLSRPQTGLRLSIETVAYTALAALAAAMRLVGLGWWPLDPNEAARALPAWQAANGLPVDGVPGSALLFQLERLTFWLLGDGDAVARLVPALAGVALVLLAARLRPLLGRDGALVAAALFAVAPLWTYLGRTADPATLAAVAIVLLLGALAARGPYDGVLAPVAAALVLAASGPAHVFVLAALLFGGLQLLRGDGAALRAAVDELWPTEADRRRGLIAFAVTLVLAATGLLTRLDGLAALLESWGQWATSLGGLGVAFLTAVVLPLVVYAPLTTAFGLLGAATGIGARGAFGTLLALWMTVALVGSWFVAAPAAVPGLLLPLTLAAALPLAALARTLAARFSWAEEGAMVGILLLVLGYGLVQAFVYTGQADAQSGLSILMRALGSVAFAVLLVAVFAVLWGRPLALRVAGLTAVLALAGFGWSNGAWLSYRAPFELREPMRPAFMTPDAELLVDSVETVSWTRWGDPQVMPVVADPALASSLAWALRHRDDVRWTTPSGDLTAPAVIVPETTTAQFGPAPYMGQRYRVAGRWEPVFADAQQFARWLLQRRPSDSGLIYERAVLYIAVEDAPVGDAPAGTAPAGDAAAVDGPVEDGAAEEGAIEEAAPVIQDAAPDDGS